MTFFAYQGTLTVPASASTVTYSDAGFQPKAIIFWTAGSTASGDAADAILGVGYCGDNTGSVQTGGSAGATSANNVATSTTSPTYYQYAASGADYAIECYDGATLRVRGQVSIYTASGFTVVWSTVTSGVIVHYLALGGTDITNVESRTFLIGTTTGNQNVVFANAFQPDLLLVSVGSGVSPGTSGMGFGAATSPTSRWSWSLSAAGAASMTSTNVNSFIQDTTKMFSCLNASGVSTLRSAGDLVSMNSNGFTYNLTTGSGATNGRYLAIKGGTYRVGNLVKAANTTQTTLTATGSAVTPKAYMIMGFGATNTTAQTTGWHMSLGGSDGTRDNSVSCTNKPGVLNTQARRNSDAGGNNNVLAQVALPSSVSAAGAAELTASHSAFTADGFTINLIFNGVASAYVLPYIMFGGVPISEPANPTIGGPVDNFEA